MTHEGTKKGHILGGGGYQSSDGMQYLLALLNLDHDHTAGAPEPALLPLEFLAHGLCIDPRDPARAAVFEKKGPGAALVNLASRQVETPVRTPATRKFYGHGAFSIDGSVLYATESLVDKDLAGMLVVRDSQTLAELGTVPTYGSAPHDCQLIADGTIMVVANGGGSYQAALEARGDSDDEAASITYVELSSGRLLEKVPIASPRFNAGHLALTPAGDLAVVSAPREGLPNINQQLGAVSLRPAGKALVTLEQPASVVERMLGETLSVVINEQSRVVLATHPLGNCVSIWRLDDAQLVGLLELSGPRGITLTLDRQWYVVSHVAERSVRLTAFSASSYENTGTYVDPSYMSGSHVYAHSWD